jgi:hypothetical protein
LVLLAQYTGFSRATLVSPPDHQETLDILTPEGIALEKIMSASVFSRERSRFTLLPFAVIAAEDAAAAPCSLSLLKCSLSPLQLAHFR